MRSIGNQIGVEIAGSGGNVERSLLANNGSSVTHYGGNAAIRQTLMRDAERHLYTSAQSLIIESSWFESATEYCIVVAPCAYDCGGTGTQQVVRSITLSGNVFRRSPSTLSNFTVLFDARMGGPSLDGTGDNELTRVFVLHNTFVGADVTPSRTQTGLVSLGSERRYDIQAWNNALHGFDNAWEVTGAATLAGDGNWSTTGTVGLLPGTKLTESPLFADAGALDFHPGLNSPLRGLAVSPEVYAPIVAPRTEPPRDAMSLEQERDRAGWADVGAFESAPPPKSPRGLPGWAISCQVLPPDALGWAVLLLWGWRRRPGTRR